MKGLLHRSGRLWLNAESAGRFWTETSVLPVFKLSFGALAIGAVAVTGLGGLNLYTYQRLTDEAPVAELGFERVGEQRFSVTLEVPDAAPREFILEGDEWQLDVRMIKWTDWLTFLGEDPLFRLDRLSGRYLDVADARNRDATPHALAESSMLDVWAFARSSGDWLPGVDAAYGSSVFLPMHDGQRYAVTLSRTGLVARALPGDAAR